MVDENHVAAGSVQQRGQNLRWAIRSVLAEDTLVCDAASDLDSGVGGDLTKDLIEAGVIGGDRKFAFGVGDLGALRGTLRWGAGAGGRFGRGGWRCWQVRGGLC